MSCFDLMYVWSPFKLSKELQCIDDKQQEVEDAFSSLRRFIIYKKTSLLSFQLPYITDHVTLELEISRQFIKHNIWGVHTTTYIFPIISCCTNHDSMMIKESGIPSKSDSGFNTDWHWTKRMPLMLNTTSPSNMTFPNGVVSQSA